ncbi:hypothetical protein PDK45_29320, partial [Bacillus cereus]|nr:hypothetical protein [Bacillus cereus]
LLAAKAQPLGVLPQPNELPRGCIAAGDRAFFCDYVLDYLAKSGISKDQVMKGGYLIRTTLDPDVQNSVKQAVSHVADPGLNGIANVMSVIKPGQTSHPILAMASSRTYGLDGNAFQTMQPQSFSLVGDGAGSIFKIFTVAAAMDMGMGINTVLDVPPTFAAKGLGGTGGLTPDTFSMGAQVWIQIKSVLFTIVWSGIVAFIAYKIADLTLGLRVSEEEEREGLD